MTTIEQIEWKTKVGPWESALPNQILRCLVGSTAHGLHMEGTDDQDWMGVFVPPPEHLFGVTSVRPSVVLRTAEMRGPISDRSGPGDIDLVLYSLRKYLHMAACGNPTVLIPLFSTADQVLMQTSQGEALRQARGLILSQYAGPRFLGYLDRQLLRLLGGDKQNRLPNRPELIERYGYDTKYAMHALRLGLQGVELMRTGRLSLPMSEWNIGWCMEVRRGEVSFDEAQNRIKAVRYQLADLIEAGQSPLPLAPNWVALDRVSVAIHEAHWRNRFIV